MQYQKIELQKIVGIHEAFKQVEYELDLEPVHLPEKELISLSRISMFSERIPISVMKKAGGDYVCTFQIGLYRWMKTHLRGDTKVWCLVEDSPVSINLGRELFFGERCFCPGLYKSGSLVARLLFDYLKINSDNWPNEYKNYSRFCRLLGVKPEKGKKD